MRSDSFALGASDGVEIHVYRWLPESQAPPRAVVQVAHGMGEHAARYARLAGRLTAEGCAVLASDHRGHGRAAKSAEDLGHFADRDGWNRVVADLRELTLHSQQAFPGVPLVLLGHSMGSVLAEQCLQEFGVFYTAAALSGSPGYAGPSATLALWIARFERRRLGGRGQSALLAALLFGRANRAFRPVRTEFDWLSRDPAEVDRYVADPLCGFALRTQSFCDMLEGMRSVQCPAGAARVPRELPVYVLSGEEDPLHDRTRALQRLLASYRDAGLTRLSHRFYPGARHELFNESNREEVCDDLLRWLEESVFVPG